MTYGDFSSPGYPGVYPTDRDCYWTIQVEPGNVVQMMFGTLSLEEDENCSKDYLQVCINIYNFALKVSNQQKLKKLFF